jgi:hypothetical protein
MTSSLTFALTPHQGRLEAGSTCSKNTGAEGAATVNRAPDAKGKGAKREMNTVKFWLEPALPLIKPNPNSTQVKKNRQMKIPELINTT